MKLVTTQTEPIKSFLSSFADRHSISRRETDVIEAILNEHSNIKDIAQELQLSPSTVNNHLNNIYDKTKTSSKAELVSKILSEIVSKYKDCNLLRKTPKVLVLDDEVEIANGLSELIGRNGLKVYVANDCKDALEKVRDLDLDFIISDIKMADQDGFAFMKAVKQSHRYNPKIIFITGFSHYELPQAQDLGAITIIQKPIDHDLLLKTVLENYIEDSFERENFLEVFDKYPLYSNELISLTLSQIGFGGLFIPISHKRSRGLNLEPKTRAEIKFKMPEDTKERTALIEIAWTRDSNQPGLTPGVGVKFVNLSDADKEDIGKFVREHKIQSYIPIGKQS